MPKRKPGSIVTYKNGAKAKVLANGRMRIISGPTKKSGTKRKTTRKKRGGSITVGGGLRGDIVKLGQKVGRDIRNAGRYLVT